MLIKFWKVKIKVGSWDRVSTFAVRRNVMWRGIGMRST